MADRKIDQQKAEKWLADVKTEIKAGKKTLDEVAKVCADHPGSFDTFDELFTKTGKFLENIWNQASKGFEDAWGKVDEALRDVRRAGEVVRDKIEKESRK